MQQHSPSRLAAPSGSAAEWPLLCCCGRPCMPLAGLPFRLSAPEAEGGEAAPAAYSSSSSEREAVCGACRHMLRQVRPSSDCSFPTATCGTCRFRD